jgi:hypothetical protein
MHTFAFSEGLVTRSELSLPFTSFLVQMAHAKPTCLGNDSVSIEALTYSIEHGVLGVIRNSSIAVSVLKKEMR